MPGEWICELLEDGDEILKETGARTEWMEDADCEFTRRRGSEGNAWERLASY